jgi:Icc-related predicted phosphoesterase
MALKIHLLSDLHLEFSQCTPHPASAAADVIIAAGDIWKRSSGLHMLRSMFPHPAVIVTVMGNHESYGSDIHKTVAEMRETAKELDIHFLENDEAFIKVRDETVRVLGCCLWTDFLLYGLEKRKDCMIDAGQSLNDFRLIRNGIWNFNPSDSINIHTHSVKWLESKLNEPFEGPTIVVTHHAPSYQSVAQRFKEDLLSACFASRLDHLTDGKKVELWCHGHTHDSMDYMINGTRVIANPRGYNRSGIDGAEENDQFNSSLIIEVSKGKVEIADTSVYKAQEGIEPVLSGRQRDDLIWEIDHLKATTYAHSDFFLEYVDLYAIKPELRWIVKSIVSKYEVLLKCIPDHLAVMPLATMHIERLIEEVIKRSRQTERVPRRKPSAGINAGKIAALNSLKLHSEDDLKFYDLVELRQDLRAEYWAERLGSTQPVIKGASEPVYKCDYEEWRKQQIGRLK